MITLSHNEYLELCKKEKENTMKVKKIKFYRLSGKDLCKEVYIEKRHEWCRFYLPNKGPLEFTPSEELKNQILDKIIPDINKEKEVFEINVNWVKPKFLCQVIIEDENKNKYLCLDISDFDETIDVADNTVYWDIPH